MESVYHCKKCSINFPSVSRYIKHRKLFCELGRTVEDENVPIDGIGKLTLAEASNRVKRSVEMRIKEVDPEVYVAVDRLQQFKSQKRDDGKKADELRKNLLQQISELKSEAKTLESDFVERNNRYKSIQAYSKLSSIEISGCDELLDELHNLKDAISYIQNEISVHINYLNQVENGDFEFLQTHQANIPKTASTKPGTVGENLLAPPLDTPLLTPSAHSMQTGVPTTVPYTIPITTPHFTTVPNTVPMTALNLTTVPDTVPVTAQNLTTVLDTVPMTAQHLTLTPTESVNRKRESRTDLLSTQESYGNRAVKPGTADSFVLLGKLQRKREILHLQKEIREMESEEQGMSRDVLADAAQMTYEPHSGIAVYIDYLTPTFHISANLTIAIIKKDKVISQSATFVVTPSTHLTYLGYNDILPNLYPENNLYLYSSVQTTQGEELGWCLFNLFSEGLLNSGSWRLPLKSPPFSTAHVSSSYHGVRSLNYSLRIRCSFPALHDLLVAAPIPKLAQYSLHNPIFEETLILDRKSQPKKSLTRAKSSSLARVVATYGTPGDFDPIKAMRRTPRSTPIRPMPAARTPTASRPISPPATTHSQSRAPVRVKGLHYHTLCVPALSGVGRVVTTTQITAIDEDYHILNTVQLPSSLPAQQTTLLNHFIFDNQTLEMEWKQEDAVLMFVFVSEGGGTGVSSEREEVGWSWCKYSDKEEELDVFSTPVPQFQDLIKAIEEYDMNNVRVDNKLIVIPGACFLVRYYDITEETPSFPSRPQGFDILPLARIPTGAFRHGDQKPNFKVHDNKLSITLAIDGARYLPSCVTISRVTGRIFDRKFNPAGPQISSGVVLESDVYNPVYKYSLSFPGNVPKTSVIVFKMYSLHAVSGQLMTVGYSVLNLFCARGTCLDVSEENDSVVLKEGAFQLPLHIDGPDASSTLTTAALQEIYRIPCAWLLVRVMYTPPDKVPPLPSYNDGVYTDTHAPLSTVESYLLDSHRQRPIKPGTDLCLVAQESVIKKLTRHKGQTVLDLQPSEIVEYSPEFGFGVKVVGIKNTPNCHEKMFVYLRLCTSGTLNQFTDHVLYNDAVLFCAADSGKVKWADQIHYFKHVIPASHVFILVQIIEHRDGRFQAVGWVILPIFAHTEPLQFVNKSLRSEVAMRPGIPDSTQLSADLELQSVLSGDEDLPLLVVEIFDSRYSSESKTIEFDLNEDYEKLAHDGIQFIAVQVQSKK